MFFSFAIVSLGRSNHSKYILEIINFKQLVHAINIGWAHENKFKLHKNVSLIKFSKKKNLSISKKGAIKLQPSLFFAHAPRTLRVLINWNEHASKGTTSCFQKIRGFCFTFCLSSKKLKYLFILKKSIQSNKLSLFQHFRPDSPPQRVTPPIVSTC